MDTNEILIADRSQRGKLRFTGEQRAWFLHQILTQAFEDIQPGEARDAAMITAHGRMLGYLETLATQESIYCHFESELRDSLPERIGSYVFATRVEIEDVTDDYGMILIAGEGWKEFAQANVPVPGLHPTRSLGIPAGYVWMDRVSVSDALSALGQQGVKTATEEELEDIRIANAVPRWGNEMDTRTFPQEVGIDTTAVHYDKGCYLGQEAMAKIHLRGKVNRRLARVEGESSVEHGTELFLDSKKVGMITSASGSKGLAVVHVTVEPGTLLHADEEPVKVVA